MKTPGAFPGRTRPDDRSPSGQKDAGAGVKSFDSLGRRVILRRLMESVVKEVDRIAAAVLAAARVKSMQGVHSIDDFIAEYDAFLQEFASREEKTRSDARAASGMTWEPYG